MTRVGNQFAAVATVLATTVLALAQIDTHSAALALTLSFGSNANGKTGLGTTSGNTLIATPIDMTNLAGKTITQVAAGSEHSLLLAGDGSVYSVGDNSYGRTGLGTSSGTTPIATPIDTSNMSAGQTISQVAAGSWHSLLLADDGTVFAFGDSSSGQTGMNMTSGNIEVATPINPSNIAGRKITWVSAGSSHNLLLADDGTVFSFGNNSTGRTGLGTTSANTQVATPIDTTNLAGRRITQVAAGWEHSLLLAEDGTVFSFGWNGRGQTGGGTTSGSTLIATPIDTSNLSNRAITQVAAGAYHSLLLAADGAVFSFGWNLEGQAGVGTTASFVPVATPIDTTNLAGRTIIQIEGGLAHSLLLADDGTVFSFGANGSGRTGLGTDSGVTRIATLIDGTHLTGLRVTDISADGFHSLILAVPEPGGATSLLIAGLPLMISRRRQYRMSRT